MTKNQIEYAKLVEMRRSNRAQEELTGTRDSRSYEVSRSQLVELGRHNLAQEKQAKLSLDEESRANRTREAETMRHNVVTEIESERSHRTGEGLEQAKLAETQRHNRTTEQVGAGTLAEQGRANRANEALKGQQIAESARQADQTLVELNRHQTATEGIQQQDADTRSSQLSINRELIPSQIRLNESRADESDTRAAKNVIDSGVAVAETVRKFVNLNPFD